MVVAVGLTESPLPEPTRDPPQLPLYHLITVPVPPPPPFRVRVVLCPLQMVAVETVAEVGLVDLMLTTTLATEVVIGPQLVVP